MYVINSDKPNLMQICKELNCQKLTITGLWYLQTKLHLRIRIRLLEAVNPNFIIVTQIKKWIDV